MEETELKPCPFCGAEAKIYKQSFGEYGIGVVHDMDCILFAARFKDYIGKEYLIAAWNRRQGDRVYPTEEQKQPDWKENFMKRFGRRQ